MPLYKTMSVSESTQFRDYVEAHSKDLKYQGYNRDTDILERQIFFSFGDDIEKAYIAKGHYNDHFLVLNYEGLGSYKIEREISKSLYDFLDTLISRSRSDVTIDHLINVDNIFNG